MLATVLECSFVSLIKYIYVSCWAVLKVMKTLNITKAKCDTNINIIICNENGE